MKFKVGDKVRVIADRDTLDRISAGEMFEYIGTVEDVEDVPVIKDRILLDSGLYVHGDMIVMETEDNEQG